MLATALQAACRLWSNVASYVRYVWQWALLCLCLPLLLLVTIAALPTALLLWALGIDVLGRRLAAKRDPVLAGVMRVESSGSNRLLFRLTALGQAYTTLVVFGFHTILSLFVILGRPRVVFVIYLNNYHMKRKYFSIGISELLARAGLVKGYM
jgi:hypothetical protein